MTIPLGDDIVVRCEDVARTFGRGSSAVVAVHRATCTVRRGHRIALVGPSGSGKSTFLHLLAGLDQPTAGTIRWPAIDGPLAPGPIGLVFQAPSLLPALDVVENTALPLVLGGRTDGAARAAALDALTRVGVESLASRLPDDLSAGQAQRVAVARAVVTHPILLLADEPTGQLDHATAAVVMKALVQAADESAAALVVATHDRAIAGYMTSRWDMRDGRLHAAEREAA